MKNKLLKSFINFLVLFCITALVLYFSLKDDYDQIVFQITNMNKLLLLSGFLLMVIYWGFKIVTIHNLATHFNKDYKIKDAARLIMETNFFHAVTPFSSGGQPYEIYSLKKSGMKVTEATNVSIQNFIVYQIALVLLGIFAMIGNHILHLFPDNPILQRLIVLGFIINTLVIVVLFGLTFGKKVNQRIVDIFIHLLAKFKIVKNEEEKLESTKKYLSEFDIGARLLLKNKWNFVQLVFIQLLSLCSLYLIPLVLFFATGDYESCNVLYAIITSAYVMLIGSFVPIPGGTGGLEYGFIVFYSNFVTSGVTAVMLVWRFITYYFGMIVGALVLNFRKK